MREAVASELASMVDENTQALVTLAIGCANDIGGNGSREKIVRIERQTWIAISTRDRDVDD